MANFTKKERSEARRDAQEVLTKDFNCILLETDESLFFNGTAHELATLIFCSIEYALENNRVPASVLKGGIEEVFRRNKEKTSSDKKEKNVRDEINDLMLEILKEMKKEIKR